MLGKRKASRIHGDSPLFDIHEFSERQQLYTVRGKRLGSHHKPPTYSFHGSLAAASAAVKQMELKQWSK